MERTHHYPMTVHWTGNLGQGTSTYRGYSRNHELSAEGKSSPIAGSSDPLFRGDRTRYNPEELIVGAASACHMLWFLHLAAEAGLSVLEYDDEPLGEQLEHADGSGEFVKIELRPRVVLSDPSREKEVNAVHQRVHEKCAVARSLRCEVTVAPR
jgi:organic hydroperoxide reductase OsmC/OhrA